MNKKKLFKRIYGKSVIKAGDFVTHRSLGLLKFNSFKLEPIGEDAWTSWVMLNSGAHGVGDLVSEMPWIVARKL